MRVGSLLAMLLFVLLAIGHAMRLLYWLPVTIGGVSIAMWPSFVGVLIPLTIATLLWRERRPAEPRKHASSFEEEVARLQAELRNVTREREQQAGDWLPILYQAFGERMRSDNERIWSTGQIFVPISLSAFAALLAIQEPAVWKTIVLAMGSCFLLLLWLFLAESHRSFQRKSEAWMVAILRTIGVQNVGVPKIVEGRQNRLFTRLSVQRMRLILAAVVFAGWVAVLVLQWSGLILSENRTGSSIGANQSLQSMNDGAQQGSVMDRA